MQKHIKKSTKDMTKAPQFCTKQHPKKHKKSPQFTPTPVVQTRKFHAQNNHQTTFNISQDNTN